MRKKVQPLIDFINDLSKHDQELLANELGTSRGYLQQIAYGFSLASPILAKRIAQATSTKVSVIDIRPDIFGDLQAGDAA